MAEYNISSQAQMDAVPKPLRSGDILWFKFSGSVIRVPVNLGAKQIKIDCFGGDSDLADASDDEAKNQGIKRLHGNMTTRRWIGRGGHASGILDLTTLPSAVEYLYVVVGEGGRKDAKSSTVWNTCTFGGGGSCDCANYDHIKYEASDSYDSSNPSKYRNTDKDPAKSFSAGGASDVRLYYNRDATDFGQLSGEPSELRKIRYDRLNSSLDHGTLTVRSLKSRIIVAGGAGAQDTPNFLDEEGPGTSGGFANAEGRSFTDSFYGGVVGYNGFPVSNRVPGGRQRQTNETDTNTAGRREPGEATYEYQRKPLGTGIFGIGGIGYYDHDPPTYASGAGGGGWFGGYASNYGGTGGSSYVAGSIYHNQNDPSITFEEQMGVTLDDSYMATVGRPDAYHNKATKTNGPRDGLVRFEVVEDLNTGGLSGVENFGVEGSLYLRGQTGSTTYGAQLFTKAQMDSYSVQDAAGSTFVKITEHEGVPYYARVTTDKTGKATNYSSTTPIRAVNCGSGTTSKENAAIFFLSDFFDSSIPSLIKKITITGTLNLDLSANSSWVQDSVASNTIRHALSLCMISHDTNGSEFYGSDANYRKLFSDTAAPIPDRFTNHASRIIYPSNLKRMYEGLNTSPEIGTRLSTLNQQITVSKSGVNTTPRRITIPINIEVQRMIFSTQHILLVAILGWKENDKWANVSFLGSNLTITGTTSAVDATPFVLTRNNTDYYILPK